MRPAPGHRLGCPHEHLPRKLVDRIDVDKAIAFFGATQGWSPDQVRRLVLTPVEESSLWGTGHSDPNSIMCYQLPGIITKDGMSIIGGVDISGSDYAFMAKVYPKRLRDLAVFEIVKRAFEGLDPRYRPRISLDSLALVIMLNVKACTLVMRQLSASREHSRRVYQTTSQPEAALRMSALRDAARLRQGSERSQPRTPEWAPNR